MLHNNSLNKGVRIFVATAVYIYIHIYMFYLSDHSLTHSLSYPNSRDAIASKNYPTLSVGEYEPE